MGEDETQERLREVLHEYLSAADGAMEFVDLLASASQTFDDLFDGDRQVGAMDLYGLMFICLVDLPRNPFYRAYFADLSPLVEAAINQWIQANDIEHMARHGDNEMLKVAYVTRSSITPIIMHAIMLVGGRRAAAQAAKRINPLIFNEPFEGYAAEHADTRAK